MRQPAGDEGEAISDTSDEDALRAAYGARIAAASLTLPKGERAAAVKALRAEMKAALKELTEKRRERRKTRRRPVPSRRPQPPPEAEPRD